MAHNRETASVPDSWDEIGYREGCDGKSPHPPSCASVTNQLQYFEGFKRGILAREKGGQI